MSLLGCLFFKLLIFYISDSQFHIPQRAVHQYCYIPLQLFCTRQQGIAHMGAIAPCPITDTPVERTARRGAAATSRVSKITRVNCHPLLHRGHDTKLNQKSATTYLYLLSDNFTVWFYGRGNGERSQSQMAISKALCFTRHSDKYRDGCVSKVQTRTQNYLYTLSECANIFSLMYRTTSFE